MSTKLIIEAGKYYRTKGDEKHPKGFKAYVAGRNPFDNIAGLWVGYVEGRAQKSTATIWWQDDGLAVGLSAAFDLVAEWTDEADYVASGFDDAKAFIEKALKPGARITIRTPDGTNQFTVTMPPKPEPKRIKGWVNVFTKPYETTVGVHETRKKADHHAAFFSQTRFACIYIDIEEGEGLEK